MAECLEVLCEANLEEQEEEVTVLQSIFEDDLQVLQGGENHANISFNLTVKVHFPHDIIDFEAFIPVEIFEDLSSKTISSCGSDSDHDPGNDSKEDGNSFSENHLDAQETRLKATSSGEENQNPSPPNEPSSNSFSGRTKPGFTRSVSMQHWHVKADIRYLTPIHLTFTFPPLYPTECPPEISLACLWLSRTQLQELKERLLKLWTETPNLPIVFTWADWLQNYAYEYLGLGSHLVLKESESETITHLQADEAINSQSFSQSKGFNTKLEIAVLTIFEYDLEMQRQTFRQSTHLCEICFDERDGTEFHYLDECRHFFCTECLKAHCQLHVDGGTVLKLLCPSHDCKTLLPPEILQEVLDPEKLERWERLLFSKTLDIMGVVYCPRCNVAVVIDEDETSKLGHCANCFFAFCTECYEPWHHGQPCLEEDSDSDKEKSGKESKGSKSKKTKSDAKIGGKAAAISLRTQRQQTEREQKMNMSNLSFIRMMKQQGKYQYCPKCRMAVERTAGCDMMHCSQCGSSFCWTCGM